MNPSKQTDQPTWKRYQVHAISVDSKMTRDAILCADFEPMQGAILRLFARRKKWRIQTVTELPGNAPLFGDVPCRKENL